MQIIAVYRLRFERGKWKSSGNIVSIFAPLRRSRDRGFRKGQSSRSSPAGKPIYSDYLEGSRYIFNVAYGSRENPEEGDLQVFAVRVNQMILGSYEDVKQYFAPR